MSKENVETARGVRYPISLPRRASQRRSLDERLFLRFPAVYRLLADRVTRLPPGSRLRRWMLARVVVRGYAAVNLDLAAADVERSLAFYRDLLVPLGWAEEIRYPTYRGTEEVVYLVREGPRGGGLGLRPADGGTHRYYDVGIEHFAFEVDRREEVDEAHARCVASGANVHFPPEEDRDEPGYYAFFVFDPDGIRVEVFFWER